MTDTTQFTSMPGWMASPAPIPYGTSYAAQPAVFNGQFQQQPGFTPAAAAPAMAAPVQAGGMQPGAGQQGAGLSPQLLSMFQGLTPQQQAMLFQLLQQRGGQGPIPAQGMENKFVSIAVKALADPAKGCKMA